MAISSSSLSMQIPNKTLVPSKSQPTVKIVSFSSFKPASHKISHPNNKILITCSTAAPRSSFATVPVSASASDKLGRLISEFQALPLPLDRVKRLLEYASTLPPFPESERTASNRVMGCTSQVYLMAELVQGTTVRFVADSDSEITKGYCACLISVLNGATPEEIMGMTVDDFEDLKLVGMNSMANSRVNTWMNILIGMQKRTRMLIAKKEGRLDFDLFPSLVIGEGGLEAKGSYAEAQAKFLSPDESKIQELVMVLKENKIGVVAHFYMDPEVQGVLTAAQKLWPHIYISDSLVMADTAVKMAEAGCQYITVLGVDFMSENVRAILDQAGFDKVGVYRMSNEQIGCSLADAAESSTYMNFLKSASNVHPSLHVIYINTSLQTKAHGHELVPTITCTSSNVVQTILQAFAQIPDVHIWYGPDSYMGANIAELFRQMANMTDEEIAEVHPKHNRSSIKSVLPRLHYYREGVCIVHDMFGHEVVEKIKDLYNDAFLTAHFEVPGEMFSLAMEAKKRGMGVVGSTKNILDFITDRVKEALVRNSDENLQFVLGTESGMITSIVAAVQNLLRGKETGIKVEIVFPVCSDSVSRTKGSSIATGLDSLTIVPGVTTGEGCSIHGGCASCPYMKMNTLQSLMNICRQLPDKENVIEAYQAGRFNATTPLGNSVAEVGCEPILHMRHFQANKNLPEKLVHQILDRSMNGAAV